MTIELVEFLIQMSSSFVVKKPGAVELKWNLLSKNWDYKYLFIDTWKIPVYVRSRYVYMIRCSILKYKFKRNQIGVSKIFLLKL